MNNFKIYVACLSSYNSGKLHGVWIDLDECIDEDDVMSKINEMLSSSPMIDAEEWEIHDTDSTIKGFDKLEIDEMLELNQADNAELISELINQGVADSVSEAIRYHDNHYQGQHDSLEAYADEYLESSGMLNEVPESLRYYIDTEKFARDLRLGGDIFTIELGGDVHVYTNA